MKRAVLALGLCWRLGLGVAHATPPAPDEDIPGLVPEPLYATQVRLHYYEILSRSPTKAFLWELALPGAGHIYTGFPIQAAVAIGLSVAGAAMWIGGAARDSDAWWWAGIATFTLGRTYGLISAPVSAALLNAAYRRQLG
ncbi:MAG TPA: hypothetical protein VFZ61_24180, partial [Polyangiales bacterium]